MARKVSTITAYRDVETDSGPDDCRRFFIPSKRKSAIATTQSEATTETLKDLLKMTNVIKTIMDKIRCTDGDI
jgi:hypothetical protein